MKCKAKSKGVGNGAKRMRFVEEQSAPCTMAKLHLKPKSSIGCNLASASTGREHDEWPPDSRKPSLTGFKSRRAGWLSLKKKSAHGYWN